MAPVGASAQILEREHQGPLEGQETVLLLTGASLANFAGLFPGIGGAIAAAYEVPNKSWSVAGVVAGGAQVTFGALSMASGAADSGQSWLTAYGAVTAALGISNLVLGLINLVRRDRALRQLALLEQSWVMTPIVTPDGRGPGVGASVSF